MKAYPIDMYPAKCRQAAAIMLMIMNNLDPRVAQFPEELITYGGNGSVFQNWYGGMPLAVCLHARVLRWVVSGRSTTSRCST